MPLLWLELAELYLRKGLADAAEFCYEQAAKALSGDPQQLVALLMLAQLYVTLQKWDNAQEVLAQLQAVRCTAVLARPCTVLT